MNHNEFVQALKAGKVSGAYLFEGVEENIKSVTLAALRKAVLADGLAELNESVMENPSAGEIIAACETLPFASDKRLVVVRELNGTTGRSEAEERLVSYIPKVPDSCVLVIYVRGKADGRKKLYSGVKKKGGIVSFEPLGDAELNGWIVRVFQQNGKKCAPDVASLLSFTVGNDTALLRAEIEKLTALAGDRDTITENDVHAVATRSIECTVFEMVDAVVAGQRARALMLLRDMLTAGQERLGILAMLLRQYRLMQHVKIMQYEKLSRQELVKNLGIAPFAAERTMRQAQGYTGAQVRRGVGICLDTEYKVKAGQYNEDVCAVRVQHCAAAAGDHSILCAERPDRLSLFLPEIRFAVLGENVRDGLAFLFYDISVCVDQRQPQLFRQDLAHCGLAAAHKTAKKNRHAVPHFLAFCSSISSSMSQMMDSICASL